MIEKALETERGEKAFREYLNPFVEGVVDQYIVDKGVKKVGREDLVKAGWAHLGMAMRGYKDRAMLMAEKKNDVFYFNTYFNWYIRQALLEYLNSKN